MTSKEALEHICRTCDHECCPYIHYDKSRCGFYGIIMQDLHRLKEINDVWHKNEVMESVDINGNHLQELYDFIHSLLEETTKLKKAIEILKTNLYLEFEDKYNYICLKSDEYDECDYTIIFPSKEDYDLLKEVLEK